MEGIPTISSPILIFGPSNRIVAFFPVLQIVEIFMQKLLWPVISFIFG